MQETWTTNDNFFFFFFCSYPQRLCILSLLSSKIPGTFVIRNQPVLFNKRKAFPHSVAYFAKKEIIVNMFQNYFFFPDLKPRYTQEIIICGHKDSTNVPLNIFPQKVAVVYLRWISQLRWLSLNLHHQSYSLFIIHFRYFVSHFHFSELIQTCSHFIMPNSSGTYYRSVVHFHFSETETE